MAHRRHRDLFMHLPSLRLTIAGGKVLRPRMAGKGLGMPCSLASGGGLKKPCRGPTGLANVPCRLARRGSGGASASRSTATCACAVFFCHSCRRHPLPPIVLVPIDQTKGATPDHLQCKCSVKALHFFTFGRLTRTFIWVLTSIRISFIFYI